MKNRIIILLIFITIACSSSRSKSENENENEHSHIGINCGFIDNRYKIELTDNKKKYNIQGLAVVVINFDNLDTLLIDSVELQTIFVRESRKVLKKTDEEFIYFQNKLLPVIEKIKCWKCIECNKETFSNRIAYSFPFTING